MSEFIANRSLSLDTYPNKWTKASSNRQGQNYVLSICMTMVEEMVEHLKRFFFI